MVKQRDDREDFARKAVLLAAALASTLRPEEQRAITRIAEIVDREWDRIGPEERARLLRQAADAIAEIPREVRNELRDRLLAGAVAMERRARVAAIATARLAQAKRPPPAQTEAAMRLAAPSVEAIEGEYAGRGDRWHELALALLAAGLAGGVSRDDLAARLRESVQGFLRRPDYIVGVAAAVLNRARVDAATRVFAEAGVQQVMVISKRDTKVCDKCWAMDGTVFPLAPIRGLLDALAGLRDPDAVARRNPFLREGRDAEGRRIVYLQEGDRRTVVAQVLASGEGGERGRFGSKMSAIELLAHGIGPPPYHPICRCRLVPA